MTTIPTQQALDALFAPRSVAVFGASEDKDKFGGRLYGALLRHQFPGTVYPINPRRDSLLGVKAYPDLDAVPGPVDVAAIALPADAAIAAYQACVARGVTTAIMISSGFGEAGAEGKARQDALLAQVQAGGPRLLGPNCLGAISTAGTALCSTIALETVPMLQGGVSLVSQSGALLGSMMSIGQDQGIGFRYLVSAGNEADLELADFIDYFAADPGTRVIACFIEHIRRPERFLAAVRAARAAGKPVVALKVGRSEASAAVARSHTGALTGDDRVNDAIFRSLGVIRVPTPEDLIATAGALATLPPAAGPRVAVLSASGGACGMLADLLTDAGMALPDLAGAMQAGLDQQFDHVVNPLDLGGMRNPTFQPEQIRATLDAIGQDPAVDQLLLGLTTMPMVDRNMAEVADFAKAWGKPVVVYSIIGSVAATAVATLQGAGIPVFTSAVAATAVLRALADGAQPAAAFPDRPLLEPPLPAAWPDLPLDDPAPLLRAYGLPLPLERLCASGDEAAAFADDLGRPVAVKIATPLVPHKTEADAVRLGVVGGAAARAAFKDVNASARAWLLAQEDAPALPDGALPVLVQEMVQGGTEVLAGVQVDPGFGPLVALGMGGILVELLDDIALRPAPLSLAGANALLEQVRGMRLLDGYRGAAQGDRAALAELVVRLSWLAWDGRDVLAEVDLNPVIVLGEGHGCRILDALLVPRPA